MPYKPLPNMLPTQTHDINISYGLRDYQNGLYPSAVAKFTKALRIKPWGVVPRFVRGLCWAQMGNNKKAADDFRVAQEEGGKVRGGDYRANEWMERSDRANVT